MSDGPPISSKVGLDTSEFKAKLNDLNRDMRVIESGFKAVAAGMGDWEDSSAGLEERIRALTGLIETQKEKVGLLERQYKDVAEAQGADSRAAEELEIKLNKERQRLGELQTELGGSKTKLEELQNPTQVTGEKMQDLETKTGGARDGLDKLKGVADTLKAGLAVGVAAIAGLALAVVGVSKAVTDLVLDSSKAAGELVDLSNKTGISTTRLQELSYVGDQVGTSADTMTGSFGRLARSLSTAREEQQEYDDQLASGKMEDEITLPVKMAAAFNQLGVSFTDASGQLRDREAVFGELITALGKIPNETERDALAMQIFGKSAMELNPLIVAGADEIARLSQEAHKMGAVVGEDTVKGLETFDDKLSGLKAGLKGTMMEVAGAFLPGFNTLVDTAQNYMGRFSEIVRGSDGDLVKMAEGVGKLIGDIAQEIATKGPEFLKAGLNIIQGIIDAVTENLPQMIQAASGIITSLMKFLTDNLPDLIRSGIEIVLALVEAIIDNLPALIDAGIEALLALMQGLSEALPRLIPKIVEAVLLIVQTLVEHLPELVEAGGKLLLAVVQGLAEALPILIEKSPELIEALAEALIELLPILGEIGLEMLKAITTAVVENLPLMGEAAGKIFVIIGQKFPEYLNALWQLGKDIVLGIWQGIKDNINWFFDQIKGFFRGTVKAANDALEAHSPSKLFGDIGKNAGQSYVDSLGSALKQGTAGLQQAFGETALALNVNANGAGGGGGGGTVINHNYQFDLSASYQGQTRESLMQDVRLLQMLYGEA